jgi:hypothetical protein
MKQFEDEITKINFPESKVILQMEHFKKTKNVS